MKYSKTLAGLALASLLALAACGGGGGGGSSVTPPPNNTCANTASDYPTCTPAPTVTVAATTPANGATDVATNAMVSLPFTTNGTLVANSANATGACGATTISGNASLGSSPWTFVPVTGFSAGTTCSVTFTGKFASAGGLTTTMSQTVTFSTKAADTSYHYGAFNAAIRNDDGNYVYLVDDTGNEFKLNNDTGFHSTTNGFDLYNCGLWINADGTIATLADNRPLASCVTAAPDSTRRNFPIDVTNKTMMAAWTGAAPAGATLRDVPYGTFGDTPYASHNVGQKGMYVDVAQNTVLFFTNSDPHLYRTGDNFGTMHVVNTGNHNLIARGLAK